MPAVYFAIVGLFFRGNFITDVVVQTAEDHLHRFYAAHGAHHGALCRFYLNRMPMT